METIKLKDCKLKLKSVEEYTRPNSQDRLWYKNKIIFEIIDGEYDSLQFDSSSEIEFNNNLRPDSLVKIINELKNDLQNMTLKEFSMKLLREFKDNLGHKVYLIYR